MSAAPASPNRSRFWVWPWRPPRVVADAAWKLAGTADRVVAGWRAPHPEVKLVDSTYLGYMKQGPERRAAQLHDAGIDVVNLHRSEWTGGLTALFHRFDLLCFGWDCQLERHLEETLDHGTDGVYNDHVDRMVDAIAAAYPSTQA